MVRFCGTSLRTFGWLVCLAGCAQVIRCAVRCRVRIRSQRPPLPPLRVPLPNSPKPLPPRPTAQTPPASANRTSTTPADPQDLAAVLAELETLGAIDAPTRDRLVDDLKKTDPALWPQLLAYFKASLAYRQKYGAGEGLRRTSLRRRRRSRRRWPLLIRRPTRRHCCPP